MVEALRRNACGFRESRGRVEGRDWHIGMLAPCLAKERRLKTIIIIVDLMGRKIRKEDKNKKKKKKDRECDGLVCSCTIHWYACYVMSR